MKKTFIILFAVLTLNASCTMDGADNPANSPESPEGTGEANPSGNSQMIEPMQSPVIDVDTTSADTIR